MLRRPNPCGAPSSRARFEAAARVGDLQAQRRTGIEQDPNLLGPGVPSGVGDGLRGDAGQRLLLAWTHGRCGGGSRSTVEVDLTYRPALWRHGVGDHLVEWRRVAEGVDRLAGTRARARSHCRPDAVGALIALLKAGETLRMG